MKILYLTFIFTLALAATNFQARSRIRLFPIEVNGKHGYIDTSGRIAIPPEFDDAWEFSEGLACVLVGDKWGYIDQSGKMVIPPKFFEAMPYKEGLALVGAFFGSGPVNDQVGNYGYIDREGRFVIAPQFGVAFSFSNGLARIQTEDYKNGYIDKTGKVVFWEERLTEDYSNDLALFKTHSNMPDSKTGYLDKAGNVAISPKFDRGETFSEGLACMLLNDKAGFIDTSGQVAIEFRFESCGSFSEGLAPVMINGKWGYIEKTGRLKIEPSFAEAGPFSDDVAIVRILQSESAQQEQRYKREGNIVSTKPGKFGVVDRNGKMILPARFVQLGNFSGLAWVNLGAQYIVHGSVYQWGYINKGGKIIWTSVTEQTHGADSP